MSEEPNRNEVGPGALPGWIVLAVWAVTAVLFYAVGGAHLGRLVEGVDPALMPKTSIVACGAALLASLVVSAMWARQRIPAVQQDGTPAKAVGRRRFLLGAATGAGGVVASAAALFSRNLGWMTVTGSNILADVPNTAPVSKPEWEGARVRAYRELGNTGFQVSDISLGSGRIRGEQGERVARMAIDRGVNYFDTAPDYSEAGSELALGRAMKGHRDQMFLATKFCTPQGHLPTGSSPQAYMQVVEESLGRLQTDYVDLVHIHACDDVDRLLDPNVHEAFDRLKEQGKARFLGVSTHTPRLEAVATAALDSNRFDVMMLAYHHGAWPGMAEIMDRADEQGVGIVAMKTLKGAKHEGLLESREEADAYSQAAFKWVLSNPSVDCLVISFVQPSHVDEYLHASGQSLTERDVAILEHYDELIAGQHCHQHCGDCLGSCPAGLRIDEILRHRMYFKDYGDEREAMRLYSKLENNASVCAGCSAPCMNACTHGIPIADYTREAHSLLTLS